eukprot:733509-Rhodomonas_salina.2
MPAKGVKPLVISDGFAKNCLLAFLSIFKALDHNPQSDPLSDLQQSFESEHMKEGLKTWMNKKLSGGVPEGKEPKDSSILGKINTLNVTINEMEDNISIVKGELEDIERSLTEFSDDDDHPSFDELPDVVLDSLPKSNLEIYECARFDAMPPVNDLETIVIDSARLCS